MTSRYHSPADYLARAADASPTAMSESAATKILRDIEFITFRLADVGECLPGDLALRFQSMMFVKFHGFCYRGLGPELAVAAQFEQSSAGET